ncbi:MAG TPA: DUF2304 domain-containing protein [Candidatus Hydrogenedentes bacterium]|nr:DUF2304 domain-containing protein [Candidatus Hydrogenedentota bacterium]HOL75399.1 DUF2304 domain-containing protein [Candidatus Hydrogenedentota bacterium]HPO84908.1 DUF2304 domain-containing protein [Candidatus Hydrogenedentota bacterium]
MSTHQRVVAAIFALTLLVTIIELVRRRKLKEEYSWLWIMAGVGALVIGLNYSLLETITRLIGAGFTSSALFFLGIFFVLALCLQFSVKISKLETQVKNLVQHISLLEAEKSVAQQEPHNK